MAVPSDRAGATIMAPAGLTAAKVAQRVSAGQVNTAPARESRSVAQILRANLLTRLNALIGSLAALILIFGHPIDAMFAWVVVFNSAIGMTQELRAKRTLDRLTVLARAPVRVRRDGQDVAVSPEQVVVGDLILLEPGEKVPVDGEISLTDGLEIDESLLTGESDPVVKEPGEPVMSGSFVVAGAGAFTATKVGPDAYAAKLVAEASTFSLAQSELYQGINRFLRLLTWIIIPVGLLLVIRQLTSDQQFADAMVSSVAGVVPMIPEGLVLMTSIAFAVGVIRLGRRQCLVQELPAVEILARVDTLCLDKTGTLTEPGMVLRDIEPTPGAPPPERLARVLAALVGTDPHPNPTIQAIVAGTPPAPHWQVTQTIPFSSARKYAGASFAEAGVAGAVPGARPGSPAAPTGATPSPAGPGAGQRDGSGGDGLGEGPGPDQGSWLLGAPEVLLPAGDPLLSRVEQLARDGMRVLALVRAESLATPSGTGVALVVLAQQLRPASAETLRWFAEQGVAAKVISGDNPVAVGAIAQQLGMAGAERPVDARRLPDAWSGAEATSAGSGGAAVSAQSPLVPRQKRGAGAEATDLAYEPAELADALEQGSVFGRVTPHQKRAFVGALRSRGHTVAMTGDGVNDTLALKDADLGIAMGSGSGASRAVAKVVLLNDDFTSLPKVLGEGRRVLANIERVANLFLTKTVYAICLALLVGLIQVPYPFLPRQTTLIAALTIGIPAFFLALAPSNERARSGFVPRVLRFAVPAGLAAAVATLTSYLLARANPASDLTADRSVATITLFLVAFMAMVLVARPLAAWKVALLGTMATAFGLVLAVPAAREVASLTLTEPRDLLLGGAAAAVAGVAMYVTLWRTGWLRSRSS